MLTSENLMIGNALLLRHLHPGLKIAPIATHLRPLVIISVNSSPCQNSGNQIGNFSATGLVRDNHQVKVTS